MGRDTLKVYTTDEAREKFNDDLPRFMTSNPTIIWRKYGGVVVTESDIKSADKEMLDKDQ
jgi:hypothetical protein